MLHQIRPDEGLVAVTGAAAPLSRPHAHSKLLAPRPHLSTDNEPEQQESTCHNDEI